MTTRTRLAALCLIAALALTGGLASSAQAEDTYDCSSLPDCDDVEATCLYPANIIPLGPCDDGNGQYAGLICGRTVEACRL